MKHHHCMQRTQRTSSVLCLQVAGVAIFAAGIYLAVTGDRYAVLTGSSYVAGAAIIIVCGLITIATSVVGLVGAVGQFRWILLIVSLTTPSHCHPTPSHCHHTHTQQLSDKYSVVHCLSVPCTHAVLCHCGPRHSPGAGCWHLRLCTQK